MSDHSNDLVPSLQVPVGRERKGGMEGERKNL